MQHPSSENSWLPLALVRVVLVELVEFPLISPGALVSSDSVVRLIAFCIQVMHGAVQMQHAHNSHIIKINVHSHQDIYVVCMQRYFVSQYGVAICNDPCMEPQPKTLAACMTAVCSNSKIANTYSS